MWASLPQLQRTSVPENAEAPTKGYNMVAKSVLFQPLWRWATHQDENFMTDSLRAVLCILQNRDPAGFERFLTVLLGDLAPTASELDQAKIRTQTARELGQTDLEIDSSLYLLIIEAKVDSQVDIDQLRRYRRELDQFPNRRCVLVLLTLRERAELPEGVNGWIRWHQVADALAKVEKHSGDAVVKFIIEDLLRLLSFRGMRVNKIENPVGYSISNLFAFLGVLREGLRMADIPFSSTYSIGENYGEYLGYFLDSKRFWIGAVGTHPDDIRIKTENPAVVPEGLVLTGKELADEIVDGVWHRSFRFDSDFYSASRERQIERLAEWLKRTWMFAQQLRPAGK